MCRRTDSLPDAVDVVFHLEVRQLLLHFLGQLVGGEAHGVDVVGAHAEVLGRGLHHLQGGAQAVVDVHHGKPRVLLQVALELAALHGVVEDLDGIVWKIEDGAEEGEGIGKR